MISWNLRGLLNALMAGLIIAGVYVAEAKDSMKSLKNTEAILKFEAWIKHFDKKDYPLVEGIQIRATSAAEWVQKQKIQGSLQTLDPQNVSAGFRITLINRDAAILKQIYEEASTRSQDVVLQTKDIKREDQLWHIEFINYLTGGYTALMNARSGEVLLVIRNPEG